MDKNGVAHFGGGVCFGAGASALLVNGQGILYQDVVALNSPAGATPTLKTFPLPASTLLLSSKGLYIRAWGTVANNANAKSLLLKFGATTLLTLPMTASTANTWEIEAYVGVLSPTTQEAIAHGFNSPGTPTFVAGATSPAETITGAITVQVTGTQTSAADLIQRGFVIGYMP